MARDSGHNESRLDAQSDVSRMIYLTLHLLNIPLTTNGDTYKWVEDLVRWHEESRLGTT